MDLDLVPLGWIHSLACLVALAAGAFIFVTPKGTNRHRQVGRAYLASMLVLNLSALGVYQLGVFFFPHVLAIVTLVLMAAGWGAVRMIRRHVAWKHVHLSCMILTYYMLIGGGVNEVYLRIDALKGILNQEGPGLIAMTHRIVMLIFLILLLGWNASEIGKMTMRKRRRARISDS
jgi:uncharacterized membrane protein